MRYILIINSKNNPKNQKKLDDAIVKVATINPDLRSRIELRYTEYAGHATDIAIEIDNKFKGSVAIISCGGDGTIHEIVNALAFRKTPVIAIPFGTGNDFVKSVNPNWRKMKLEDYFLALDDVKFKAIDLIKLDSFDAMGNYTPAWSSYVDNVASIGLDTKVQSDAKALVAAHNTNFTRKTAYVRAALRNLFGARANHFQYTIDLKDGTTVTGQSHVYTLISICNGKYYGDGFTPAPDANLDDGYARVCAVDHVTTMNAIGLIIAYRFGKHIGKRGIHYYEATSGVITSLDPSLQLFGNYDGEDFFGNRVRFEVCPLALNLGFY
ncbi:MAG: hypothetical protein MJ094_05800 [Saccharofermentans sp.]|nr:hypothetical protein [Saccharofermentans sp.]